MNNAKPPSLTIPAGTQFGYRSGLPWNRRDNCLVTVPEPLSAGTGLHLFVAPNGSGKTTLLRTLAGLASPIKGTVATTGRIHYFSDELRSDPELKPGTLFRAWFKGEALAYAQKLAEKLRLNLRCPVGKLSRGNRQKVLLIAAETEVAHSGASLLLMDEPLSGLDRETREVVTDLWATGNHAVLRLIVMHELESAHRADSLFSIVRGSLRQASHRVGGSWMDTYQALQNDN